MALCLVFCAGAGINRCQLSSRRWRAVLSDASTEWFGSARQYHEWDLVIALRSVAWCVIDVVFPALFSVQAENYTTRIRPHAGYRRFAKKTRAFLCGKTAIVLFYFQKNINASAWRNSGLALASMPCAPPCLGRSLLYGNSWWRRTHTVDIPSIIIGPGSSLNADGV